MKIKEYDTNELLMIANNVTGEYPEKKVRQAKEELYRRGVDDKVIADIVEEKEETFMRGWMLPHVRRKPAWTNRTRRTGMSVTDGGN
mgnify:CR=1 FL=1